MDVAITFASILAPVVLALVQVVKASFPIPKNLVPLLGLILGIIVGGLAYPFTDLTVPIRLWSGAIAGLISVGLFETFNTRTGLTITKEPSITAAEPIISQFSPGSTVDSNSNLTQDVAKNLVNTQKIIGPKS